MKTVGFEIGNQLIGVMGGDAIMEEVMKTAEPTPKMIPVEVLDKIRAEIIQERESNTYGEYDKIFELCLLIIDKYRKEQE